MKAVVKKSKLIFCITEDDVLILAAEIRKRNKITPEVMQQIRERICGEFRYWDSWIKEFVIPETLKDLKK